MSLTPRPRPIATRLGQIVDGLAGRTATLTLRGSADTIVTGVTHVAAEVRAGDLFAALPGARTHGIRFLDQARQQGAVAVLTDAAGAALAGDQPVLLAEDPRAVLGDVAALVYGHPGEDLLVIGVTGTNGKTTVTYLLEAGLAAAGMRTGLIGTTGIHVGSERFPSARTTPEAPDLHAILGVMRDAGVQAVAMEVSSHALALGRVDGLRFACSVFTNLSQDHLDFHGDMATYFAAKAMLFEPQRTRQAVIGVDDEWGRSLAATVTVPVTTVGLESPAEVRSDGLVTGVSGAQRIDVAGVAGTARIDLALPGRFNAANALMAWATLRSVGIPAELAAAGIADVRVPGRMETIDTDQPFAVIVDYAHSPDAVARALRELAVPPGGRRIAVLGCGGDRDVDKRPEMGRIAAEIADVLVVTDDNPRSEDPAEIRRQMLSGVDPARPDVHEIADRRAAIRMAISLARPGDAVLILGKGHETGQEVDGLVHPFDDRVEARAALMEVTA